MKNLQTTAFTTLKKNTFKQNQIPHKWHLWNREAENTPTQTKLRTITSRIREKKKKEMPTIDYNLLIIKYNGWK